MMEPMKAARGLRRAASDPLDGVAEAADSLRTWQACLEITPFRSDLLATLTLLIRHLRPSRNDCSSNGEVVANNL